MIHYYKDGNFELDQKYFKQYNYALPNYYTKNSLKKLDHQEKR